MKKKFDKTQRSKRKKIQHPRKEQIYYCLVDSKKTPNSFDSFFDLFDPELISFYEFDPEKETLKEACKRIREIEEIEKL